MASRTFREKPLTSCIILLTDGPHATNPDANEKFQRRQNLFGANSCMETLSPRVPPAGRKVGKVRMLGLRLGSAF
jgi:hypothetical protein